MNGKSLLSVSFFLLPPWALFMLCCYWYFFDTNPPAKHTMVNVTDEFGVTISSVRRGTKILIVRDSCVLDEGKAFYSRWLMSHDRSVGYAMPSGELQMIKGCARRYNDLQIPAYIDPGIYDYVVTLTFVNNPLVETRMILPIPTIEVTR